jgi:predicted GIY-YIG superfamily endonuclease
MAKTVGVLYLLHFDRPFGPPHQQARHYLGWTGDLDARLAAHADGTGANLLRHVRNAGIGWTLVRTWPSATRVDERAKHTNGHARRCPVCRAAAA